MLESRRISAGFVLAVCAFLVLMRARGQARPWPARALAAFLALTVLFAIEGRTGHVVVIVLVVVCRMAPQPAALALGGCRGKPAAGVGVRHEFRR